jgi:NADH dehydrogenase
MNNQQQPHHVVIIGGGFGGLYAAKVLGRAPVKVTLIDKRNFHLFQPLLYQVATGGLSPGEIASPLRAVLNPYKNTWVITAEVTDIDPTQRKVIFSDGELTYDTLIVAAGVSHHYFGHDEWEPVAPGLKTIENALDIRRRIFMAYEAAERETDPAARQAWMTFVIVGAGPTGVELAGALGELAHSTLKGDFRNINPDDVKILLVENDDRVLPPYPTELSARADEDLTRLGVTLQLMTRVTDVQDGVVTMTQGDRVFKVPCRTVLWAAGVKASPIGQALAQRAGVQLDRAGRVIVQPDLTIPGHPEMFVIGDLASFSHQNGKPLPGVAPVAMQQGRYVANLINARLEGKILPPFRYHDKGSLAVIGRNAAVADLNGMRLSGSLAWLIWVFVHIGYLIEFDNKMLVMFQWAWNYFTRKRGARLITGEDLLPPIGHSAANPRE